MVKNFLFPRYADSTGISLLLLALRLLFGLMLLGHGIDKMEAFQSLYHTFPNPLGLGSALSLSLAIFAEAFCAAAVVGGVLFRLSLVPIIFSMCVAFVAIHHASIGQGELAFIYLAVFCLLFVTGPGRFSIDYLVWQRLELARYKRSQAQG